MSKDRLDLENELHAVKALIHSIDRAVESGSDDDINDALHLCEAADKRVDSILKHFIPRGVVTPETIEKGLVSEG